MSLALRGRLNFFYQELKGVLGSSVRHNSTTTASHKASPLKYTLAGVGLGAIAGGGYSLYKLKDERSINQIKDINVTQGIKTLKLHPDVPISRKISAVNGVSNLEITLFQYPTCPFCCKVRAFLDYFGVSYNVVEVNPVLRQQIKWSQYKKVPILLIKVGDEYLQLNDSSMIISCLTTYLKNPKANLMEIASCYPSIQESKNSKKSEIVNKYFVMNGNIEKQQLDIDKDERKWRAWADNVFVHTLSPNVYRTKEEALQAFQWFSEVGEWDKLFSSWETKLVIYVGAYAMWMIGKKLKKRYNLKNDVRQSLYDECRNWTSEVNKRGKFFGGASPNLADLAVYGVLSSIEGCQAFKELLDNTNIGSWFYNMKNSVENHNGLVSLH